MQKKPNTIARPQAMEGDKPAPKMFRLSTRVTTTEHEYIPVTKEGGMTIGGLVDERLNQMREYWARNPDGNARLDSIEISELEEFM